MEPTSTTTQLATLPIQEIISDEFLELLRAHRVTRAYLFGSVVNGDFGPESDLDLLVTFDRPVTMFDQLRLAERLRHVCGRPVDLMTEIHPAFVPFIVPTLVHLPL
jgi:predicted nucleotidyltransferase